MTSPAIELRALDSNLWDQYRHFYFGALPAPARPPENGIWLARETIDWDLDFVGSERTELCSGLMLFPSDGPYLTVAGFAANEELSAREKHECARITLRLLFEYAAITGKRVIIPRLTRSMALGMLRRGYQCHGAEWTPPPLKIKTPQPGKVKPAAGLTLEQDPDAGPKLVTNAAVRKNKSPKRTARKAPRKRSKRVAK